MKNKQQQKLQAFLNKEKNSLFKDIKARDIAEIKANILSVQDLEEAALKIKSGGLVAFPTETVYGLGANACDSEALKKIYQTKKRPLTDPIIVHVVNEEQAEKLILMSQKQRVLFKLLAKQFWPGPLTMILKANLDVLPLMVTAQTGLVGIRAPKAEFARKLIEASGLPIAAPSANLFSHVSPTEPVHVFNDFYDCDISIVDGDRCEFGVESTVIKLLDDQIHVLREGSLSVTKLQMYLKSVLEDTELPSVIIHRKIVNKQTNMESPGQALKHYAPYLPCYFLVDEKRGEYFEDRSSLQRFKVSEAAFISFDEQKFEPFKKLCKFYFSVGSTLSEKQGKQEQQELFCSKEEKAKMREIYFLLRRCENLAVNAIVIGWSGDRSGTLWDKIFRSTQGEQLLCVE